MLDLLMCDGEQALYVFPEERKVIWNERTYNSMGNGVFFGPGGPISVDLDKGTVSVGKHVFLCTDQPKPDTTIMVDETQYLCKEIQW